MTTPIDDDTYTVDHDDDGPNYYRADRPPTPIPRYADDPDVDPYVDDDRPRFTDAEFIDDDDLDLDDDSESSSGRGRVLIFAGAVVVFGGIAGMIAVAAWGVPALIIGGSGVAAAGAVVGSARAAHRNRTGGGPGGRGNRRNRRGAGPGVNSPRVPRPRRTARGGGPSMPTLGGSKAKGRPKAAGKAGGKAGGKGKSGLGLPSMPTLGGSKGKGAPKGKGTAGRGTGGTGGGRGRTGGGPKGTGGGRAGAASRSTPRTPRSHRATPRLRLPRALANVLTPNRTARPPRGPRGGNGTTPNTRRATRRTWHNPLGIPPVRGRAGRLRRAAARAAWYPLGLPMWAAARWGVYWPLSWALWRGPAAGVRWLWRHPSTGWGSTTWIADKWWDGIDWAGRKWRGRTRMATRWRAFRAFAPLMLWWRNWLTSSRKLGKSRALLAALRRGWDFVSLFFLLNVLGVPEVKPQPRPHNAHRPAPTRPTPAPIPQTPPPFDPYAGKPAPGPDPDAIDLDRDTDAPPAAPVHRRRTTAPPQPSTPTGSGRTTQGAAPVTTLSGFFTSVHPALQNWRAAWALALDSYDPKSIPDLNRYLMSQPYGLIADRDTFHMIAVNLSARFPGANLIHPFFIAVGNGMGDLATNGHDLFSAWRTIHAADIARHEQPRVNEQLADVAIALWGGQLPPLPDGSVMHERIAMLTGAARDAIGNYFPGTYHPDDAVIDLMWFLAGLPNVFHAVHLMVKDFADKLVRQYPIDVQMHAFYHSYAAGWLDLVQRAAELGERYGGMNAGDVLRRLAPRANESWADAGNKRV